MPWSPARVRVAVPAKQAVKVMTAPAPMMQMATGGQAITMPKRMDQSLWDTEYINPGVAEQTIQFFTSNTYQTGPLLGTAKTRVDTNMDTEGSLPSPRSFAAKAIQVSLLHDANDGARPTLIDMQRFRAHTLISFLQGSKPIWNMNSEKLPGPGFNVASVAVSGVEILNLGTPVITDFHRFGFIIGIKEGYTFSVQLFGSDKLNLESPMRVRVKLIGDMTMSLS